MIYYKDDLITLYHGDCRDILPTLDPSENYFVFTDPPYNVGKDYDGWNDDMPPEEYFAFCETWIAMCKSLAKEICVYPPKKHLLKFWNMLGEQYQQVILTWTPEGAFRYGYVDQFAVLLSNAKPKQRTKNLWNNVQVPGLGYFFREDNQGHPGYTSEDVTARVIANLAWENVTILDPFGGSGTTARICKNFGMKCVTIEYSEKWCKHIAGNRLLQTSVFEQLPTKSNRIEEKQLDFF